MMAVRNPNEENKGIGAKPRMTKLVLLYDEINSRDYQNSLADDS